MAFVVLYDACVLYPASLRDLLIRLGQTDLFQAKWTRRILDEMVRAVTRVQPELRGKLDRTVELMNVAIRDCLVEAYEETADGLQLPDEDDRHVLAAAIAAKARVIVTYNLRDFPDEVLEPHSVEAQHPDVFLSHLLGLAPETVEEVIEEQAGQLSKPPQTVTQLLARFQDALHLRRFVEELRGRGFGGGPHVEGGQSVDA